MPRLHMNIVTSFVDRSNTFASCILTQYFFQRNLFSFIGIFLCHTSQITNVFFDPKPTLSTFLSDVHEFFSAFIAVFSSFFFLIQTLIFPPYIFFRVILHLNLSSFFFLFLLLLFFFSSFFSGMFFFVSFFFSFLFSTIYFSS